MTYREIPIEWIEDDESSAASVDASGASAHSGSVGSAERVDDTESAGDAESANGVEAAGSAKVTTGTVSHDRNPLAGIVHPASDANKYSRGKLVVVAGSARYPGAAVLAARAGQRMGAGYTEVITAKQAIDVVRLSSPSLVVRSMDRWDAVELPPAREGRPCAVCVGPGFVPGAERSDALLMHILKYAQCPVLVDGGALSGLASTKAVKRLAKRADKAFATVITPHGGEAARLAQSLKLKAEAPDELAAELARVLHCTVVLKGPDTYVSDGQCTQPMTSGTAALSKAGTGDVLAGMISALLAQGVPPFDAAFTGASLHAKAGVLAAQKLTDIAVCAEDVIDFIPAALA